MSLDDVNGLSVPIQPRISVDHPVHLYTQNIFLAIWPVTRSDDSNAQRRLRNVASYGRLSVTISLVIIRAEAFLSQGDRCGGVQL